MIELVNKRTLTSKTFDLGQGKRRLTAHIGPIHYRVDPTDNREPWRTIDRTLQATGRGVECLTNTYQIRIDEKTVPGEAEFTYRGKSARIAPVALEYRTGGTAQRIATFEATRPVLDGNTITWPDAFGKGIDFQYVVSHLGFQKKVIVNGDLPPALIGGRDDVRLCAVMAMSWDAMDAPVVSDGRISTEFSDKAQVLLEVGKTAPAWGGYWKLNPAQAWDGKLNPAQAWDGDGGVEAKTELMSDNGNVFAVASVDVGDVKRGLVIDPVLSPIPITDGGDDGDVRFLNLHAGSEPFVLVSDRTLITVGDSEDSYPPIFTSAFMRFVGLPIPVGATIDAANVTLVAYVGQYDGGATPTGALRARKVANCPQITNIADYKDLVTYPRTTAAVTWWPNYANWDQGQPINRTSPDIKTVIQEVVDLAGWKSGNAIQVEWLYDGRGWFGDDDEDTENNRVFFAYEHPTENGPILNVEYSGGEPEPPEPSGKSAMWYYIRKKKA